MSSQPVPNVNSSSSVADDPSVSSVDNGPMHHNDGSNGTCSDSSSFDVMTAAHLLCNLDTTSIHTPPDITLLTNFGDEDDSYSSASSPDKPQQPSVDYDESSSSYSQGSQPNLSNSTDHAAMIQSDRTNAEQSGFWNSQRSVINNVSDGHEFSSTFAGTQNQYNTGLNYSYQPYSVDVNTNDSTQPPSNSRHFGLTELSRSNIAMVNVNESIGPSSWMAKAPTSVPNTATSSMSTHDSNLQWGIQTIFPSSSRMTKPSHPEASGGGPSNWSNNSQPVPSENEHDIGNAPTYNKMAATAYNRQQTEEHLLTCCQSMDSSHYNPLQSMKPLGVHYNVGVPFNSPWSHLSINSGHNQLVGNQEMYLPPSNNAPFNYIRPYVATTRPPPNFYQPPLSMVRSPVNYNPFPGDIQSFPLYYHLSYSMPHRFPNNFNSLQSQNSTNNKMFRPTCNSYIEVNSNETGNNQVLDMSTKQLHTLRPRNSAENQQQQLAIPTTSAPGYEVDPTIVSTSRCLDTSCSLDYSSNMANSVKKQPQKSTWETPEYGSASSSTTAEQDCPMCNPAAAQQQNQQMINQQPSTVLPSFRENFGTHAIEARRSKPKNSYVTVRELLLSRRNDDISKNTADKLDGSNYAHNSTSSNDAGLKEGKMSPNVVTVTCDTSYERATTTTTTNASGCTSTLLTNAISLPISSTMVDAPRLTNRPCKYRKRGVKSLRKSPPSVRALSHQSFTNVTEGKSILLPMLLPPQKASSILYSRLTTSQPEETATTETSNSERAEESGKTPPVTTTNDTTLVPVSQDQMDDMVHTRGRRSSVMASLYDNRRDYRPPRHYDMLCLRIGSFRVVQPVTAPITNRLKVYFIRRAFVYEFEISHLNCEATIAAIEIPFSLVTAIHCEDSEVIITVLAPPKLYLGIKQKRSGAVKAVAQFDREHPTDITNGQLSSNLLHKLYLKQRQGENLRSYLMMYEESFKELFDNPVCMDTDDQQELSEPGIGFKQEQSESNIIERYSKRQCVSQEIAGGALGNCPPTVSYVACHCQVSCSSNRCSCMKSRSKCGLSGTGCMCRNCDNPLNILEAEGINIFEAVIDICLVQKIVNFKGNLKLLLNKEISLDCCGSKTTVKCCIPGRAICPNPSCERKVGYKYSWCQQQLCFEDIAPRNHCSMCKMCRDPTELHCQVCRRCNPIGGNGAKCTFCGNMRDTQYTEVEVVTALMRYRNGPTSQKIYQVVHGTNKGSICRLETTNSNSSKQNCSIQTSTSEPEPSVLVEDGYEVAEMVIESINHVDQDKNNADNGQVYDSKGNTHNI